MADRPVKFPGLPRVPGKVNTQALAALNGGVAADLAGYIDGVERFLIAVKEIIETGEGRRSSTGKKVTLLDLKTLGIDINNLDNKGPLYDFGHIRRSRIVPGIDGAFASMKCTASDTLVLTNLGQWYQISNLIAGVNNNILTDGTSGSFKPRPSGVYEMGFVASFSASGVCLIDAELFVDAVATGISFKEDVQASGKYVVCGAGDIVSIGENTEIVLQFKSTVNTITLTFANLNISLKKIN